MKSPISIAGIILVFLGILALGYQGYTYKKHENIAQIGDLKITAETKERVDIPPYLGGIALVAGLALVFLGTRKK